MEAASTSIRSHAGTQTTARAIHNHYPGLDGLRAIAVFLVFLQHYASSQAFLFGWGWTGVDIFFVLSGFLITGILYDSQNQTHRYRDFYIRRTLRIFPLYYAVWLVILLATPWAQWQWNFRWALWPAHFGNYARFLFLHQPGNPYRFDRLTCGPLMQHWFGSPMHLYIGHFWSLCVEEQFYLVWPLVVYSIRKRETLMKICIAVIIAAPILRWYLTTAISSQMLSMELLYRSMPTRIDALLIGGLIALCLRGPEKQWLQRSKHALLCISAALFVLAYFIAVKLYKLPYKGSDTNWVAIFGFTLIDIFAAALILETIHPGSWWTRLLSREGLRNFGVISYGFYVYHDLLHDLYASRLIGTVQSVGNAQQRKMFVTFHRAVCPDGFSLDFDKYIGLDPLGTTGLATKVDHGYLMAFGAAAAVGGLGGLAQIGNNGSVFTPSTQIRSGISEQTSQEGEQILNHFLNRLPVITLKEGSRARVYVGRDILIPSYAEHRVDPAL